jgi:hypothetical protein
MSKIDLHKYDSLAERHGWEPLDYQASINMVSYQKVLNGFPARINIYLTKMTVGTVLIHPQKGKTQLFRKNVPDGMLKKIFINPRTHTNIGYYKKNT